MSQTFDTSVKADEKYLTRKNFDLDDWATVIQVNNKLYIYLLGFLGTLFTTLSELHLKIFCTKGFIKHHYLKHHYPNHHTVCLTPQIWWMMYDCEEVQGKNTDNIARI